jgi:site-specific recombinase XerD
LKDFLAWYSAEARPPISRAIVQQYRSVLESASLSPPSSNLRLSAICKLAAEAADNGLLDRSVAQGIVALKGVRQSGDRAGNWLSREQARDLLAQPEIETTEGKRDRAIPAVPLGCALRRSELAALQVLAHPAAGRPLGVRRPRGEGKEDQHGPHPAFLSSWRSTLGRLAEAALRPPRVYRGHSGPR